MTSTAPTGTDLAGADAAAGPVNASAGPAPVTPCAPAATVEFVAARFGERLAASLDPSSRAATSRAARIGELRRCGQLRDAERYGWLSLTGWMLGLPATVLARIDPAGDALRRRASGRDLLPESLAEDPEPVPTDVPGTGLLVPNPRDPLGWAVLGLAATALTTGVVEIGGRRLGGGAVTAALTARLRMADRG